MITRIKVMNFKSLENVEICDLPRFVCLIGVNGSGKTSFIQLLSFIRALIEGKVDKWSIGGKPCEPRALAYAGASKRNLELDLDFTIPGENIRYHWCLTYNLYDCQLVRESLSSPDTQQTVLSYEAGRMCVFGKDMQVSIVPNGSALSIPVVDATLDGIRAALSGFAGVGVLDPVAIADVARPIKGGTQIEDNGAKLPAFLSQLSAQQSEEYEAIVRDFYGDFDGIEVKGTKFGWKRLVFDELKRSIDALHMNYGTLRYMVMAAMKYSKASLLYFDEVDNGINQEYLGKVAELLRSFSDKQVIVTTHNVQFLNNLTDDESRRGVFFFYKDVRRTTHVKRFFDLEGKSSSLAFESAGSIVSMTDLMELGRRLSQEEPAK